VPLLVGLVWGLACFAGDPRLAQAYVCGGSLVYPTEIAPPDTLLFIEDMQEAPDGLLLSPADDPDVVVLTTEVAVQGQYAILRPERLLDEGVWQVHGSLASFEVTGDIAPDPEIPRVQRLTLNTDVNEWPDGRAAEVVFTFEEPAAAILVQVARTNAKYPYAPFEVFGETVHLFSLRDRAQGEELNQVLVGQPDCYYGLALREGEWAELRFAAMTADGRISAWSEAHRATTAPGCSIAGAIGSRGSNPLWLSSLPLLVQGARRRRSGRHR